MVFLFHCEYFGSDYLLSTFILKKKLQALIYTTFTTSPKTNPPCLPQLVKLNAVIRQYKRKTSTPVNVSFFSLLPCCSKLEGQVLQIAEPTESNLIWLNTKAHLNS